MCLILLAWQSHPEFPLIVAANRDEFFARPTEEARFWAEAPAVLAGRDLLAGGSWMGVTREGRFAAVTNFREPESSEAPPETLSRGRLVSEFLRGALKANDYLNELVPHASACKGFNLLCGSLEDGLWHYSNRARSPAPSEPVQRLAPGIYGLSNNLLDAPWPKVAQGKSDMAEALTALPREELLFELLRDEKIHEDARLPRTGVSLEWERVLSAAFVRAPHYGTRSSTVLKIDRAGFVSLDEQTYLPNASQPMASKRNRFRFKLATSGAS